jgi:hypothetical protein
MPVHAAARAQIEELLVRYAHAIDNDEIENWPLFFAEDGQYLVTTLQNHAKGWPVGIMYCDGRGMMQDRVTALRQAIVFEPHVYRHIVGSTLTARRRMAATPPKAISTSCAPRRTVPSSLMALAATSTRSSRNRTACSFASAPSCSIPLASTPYWLSRFERVAVIEFLMIRGAPQPVAPFSHATAADGWLFVTGQMPTDPDDHTAPLPVGIEAQTRRVIENLKLVLAGAG